MNKALGKSPATPAKPAFTKLVLDVPDVASSSQPSRGDDGALLGVMKEIRDLIESQNKRLRYISDHTRKSKAVLCDIAARQALQSLYLVDISRAVSETIMGSEVFVLPALSLLSLHDFTNSAFAFIDG